MVQQVITNIGNTSLLMSHCIVLSFYYFILCVY